VQPQSAGGDYSLGYYNYLVACSKAMGVECWFAAARQLMQIAGAD